MNLLRQGLEQRSKGDYLYWQGAWHSFDSILLKAEGIAAQLRGSKMPVIVYGHKGPEMVASVLACLLAGRPFLPLDISLPLDRRLKIQDFSGSDIALCCEANAGFTVKMLVPSEIAPAQKVDWRTFLEPSDVAYIIFTSGTTGAPKGVQITLEALNDFLEWTTQSFSTRAVDEVWVNHALFSFDLSVLEIWTSLASSTKMLSLDHKNNANSRANIQAIAQAKGTHWVSTPSFIELCFIDRKFGADALPSLKHFFFCGEVLANETAEKIFARFPGSRVWNLYGPTEATCATTFLEVTPALLQKYPQLPVGFAKPGSKVFLEEGQLVVAGKNVSIGYLNQPELTKEKFFLSEGERAYRTGDLGRIDGDGLIHCLGRADHQIKFHGYRIELAEIELQLRALPGVSQAACLPITKDGKVSELVACLSANAEGSAAKMEVWKTMLKTSLPAYMVPGRMVVFSEGLPLNLNGKIDRKQLMSLLIEGY